MGSPDFAVPSLFALSEKYPIVGVVTQPDRPSGRGQKLTQSPVKKLAFELGLPVIQPQKLAADAEANYQLEEWNPDVIVVSAFGQILKKDVLELAPFGCINIHASLLPRWRGVSPIQAAILNGDTESGITIMRLDEGIDTGDIIHQCRIPIAPDETGGSLNDKLADLSGKCLLDCLPGYLRGELVPQPQGESPTPYAPKLRKSDGELDLTKPGCVLERQIRAYNPWPGAFINREGKLYKIYKAHTETEPTPGVGVFTSHNGYPAVGVQDGLLVIDHIQPAGKKIIQGDLYLRGARDWA